MWAVYEKQVFNGNFFNYSLWFFIIAQTIAKIAKTDMHFFITVVL